MALNKKYNVALQQAIRLDSTHHCGGRRSRLQDTSPASFLSAFSRPATKSQPPSIESNMQKWRWFLRAVLFLGNCAALIFLVQDAAQQLMYSPDDDSLEAAMLMPNNNGAMDDDRPMPAARQRRARTRMVGGGMFKGRKQGQIHQIHYVQNRGNIQQRQRQQQQELEHAPDIVPHPMQRRPQNNKKKRQGKANIIDEANLLKAANFSHFLIHIPKAGGTFARHQLNKDMRANKLVRERGILCDKGISPVNNYMNWPTYYDNKRARDRLAEQKEARRLGPDSAVPRIAKIVRQQCGMYMTESHWSDVPQHVYSIIRDPREHIVSAYFHCKESKHHGKKFGHLMPDTLDEWLNEWVETKRKGKGLLKAQALKRMERLRCYNPINMQSSLLLAPATPPSYGEESAPAPVTKGTLADRFDVLGLTSQMDKSLCMIFIRWNGIVPNRCDCSKGSDGKKSAPETDDEDSAGDSNGTEDEGGNAPAGKLAHHGAIHSHNVTNHGVTHEHTKEQLAAIEELADIDMKLYAVAEELFAEQVADVEREFSIKLC